MKCFNKQRYEPFGVYDNNYANILKGRYEMLISNECVLRKCDISDYQIEILEGEGMILVSETKDQIVFFNETAMLLWNMVEMCTRDRC